MKKKLVLFVGLLVAVLILVPSALAQPTTYNSGFQVQNLSDTDATISIAYYNQNGSQDPSSPVADTIPAGASKTYFPIAAASGFDGSVVISSDQPVAAIANVLGDGFAFGASYGSFSGGASLVNLPLIMKGNSGFDTWFNVQNAGTTDATVTVSYAGQAACDEPATIAPGAAHTFSQGGNTCLPAGYVGAATVDAGSGSVVATVMQTGPTTLLAYNGFTSASPSPVMPLINANNSGFVTGVQVQNTGATATDVTLSYVAITGLGTDCSETQTIPANSSATFAYFAFTGTGVCGGAQFVGSASVSTNSAGNDLVAIVNQLNSPAAQATAYGAFDTAAATDVVVMPLIMDRNSGYYTGFNVQNVSGGDLTVTCDFTDSTGTVVDTVTSGTLGDGDAFNNIQLNQISAGFVGAGSCASSGGSIIGVVNELGASGSDSFFTYEGFNN
jgi:hypothetical protein